MVLLFDLLLFFIYTAFAFTVMMLVQFISYRIFKFNLYKKIKYVLVEREVR